jgi:uncharacterized membrane protein
MPLHWYLIRNVRTTFYALAALVAIAGTALECNTYSIVGTYFLIMQAVCQIGNLHEIGTAMLAGFVLSRPMSNTAFTLFLTAYAIFLGTVLTLHENSPVAEIQTQTDQAAAVEIVGDDI